MEDSNGKKRVIITNISPLIEGGRFPVKAVQNEPINISADIFGDGHDLVAASAFIRTIKNKDHVEFPLEPIDNDRWQTSILIKETGWYEVWIEGWEDHYSNWKKGLKKKFEAGQDIDIEILIGVRLLEKASQILKEDQQQLLTWAEQLKNSEKQEAVSLALGREIAAVMYKYRPDDLITRAQHTIKIEVERKKAAFSTWYELFPRSASKEPAKHGTFKDVEKLLPRIAKMGFDVLYFPPIHPIGEKNRKGKNNSLIAEHDDPGSPWAIGNRLGGHKSIHPELGSLDDFKQLIKEAKKLDIELAMDIAYQCAPDHPYVKSNPQWFIWRPDGTVQYAENPPKKYEDILPFNFETDDWKNLWMELKSVIDYWIDAGIRIFRIDNPHTKAFRFWEWMIGEVRTANPDIIFLAEAFTRPRIMEQLAKAGFNQSYTYFTWRNSKYELESYVKELAHSDMRHYFRPNFWPNTPDILPPALVHGGENAHIMRLILAATLSSNYGLYGPVYEFGVNTPHGIKEEYVDNEKYEIKHWDWDKYTRIREIITLLNTIRKENPAFHTTWNIEFLETSNDQIMAYLKVDAESNNKILTVVNLDVWQTQGAHIRIPLYNLEIQPENTFLVNDLLSGSKYRWQGEWQYVELNPYLMPAHVFKIEY